MSDTPITDIFVTTPRSQREAVELARKFERPLQKIKTEVAKLKQERTDFVREQVIERLEATLKGSRLF